MELNKQIRIDITGTKRQPIFQIYINDKPYLIEFANPARVLREVRDLLRQQYDSK